MKGQWIGSFNGTTSGHIIVNVDELKDYFQGVIYLLQNNNTIPNVAANFRTVNKSNTFQFSTNNIQPINPFTQLPDVWSNIKQHYPNAVVANSAVVNGTWKAGQLSFSWQSNLGDTGACTLKGSNGKNISKLRAKKINWNTFKKYISTLEGRRYLFRGQNKPWSLRTSFHRTGRANVQLFIDEDIQALSKHLSSRTKHIFNLSNPHENGAFFNLVQHHGYPTPLLDWTYSPYVAAYFAYRNITREQIESADATSKVRIFIFDQNLWKTDYLQSNILSTADLHVSISDFMAIENERMIPQQSASTVTNVDDIESYIKQCETVMGKTYLQAFDLPLLERDKVIQELRYMGITAGSMFPGLDGACEEIKDRNFKM